MAVRGARKKVADKEHYHHGDLRRALLDASLELISKEGFGALSLREVARRAGVTHAAPYRHFADKEALLAAVAEEGFRAMTARMRQDMAREPTPMERLMACGVAYVLFAVENAAHFRVMFGPHFTRPLTPSESQEEGNSFQLLVDAILEAQRAGEVRAGEPHALALTCWSLVHGLASLWVDRQLEHTGLSTGVEALAWEQTRMLMRGLALTPAG
ncbi:Transcriptional regulator, TetR family [Cystobacter fuscus DSM 2262]|uniref:Transcriptional regulator, TetR family n=1 Tax=Cystobacter fuscus (strain ATCC 25194 / DSM 2262 / NBRC 100088 / M29) TaxID=1242864 RepID=S9QRH8_CYSF2|nr:TetR/AcrR family transcriptional regulator [Cystobacter fuscus]EPX59213.1 Transcriptional regulator, TetR family [Cystobacter fuscus DSM 2262]